MRPQESISSLAAIPIADKYGPSPGLPIISMNARGAAISVGIRSITCPQVLASGEASSVSAPRANTSSQQSHQINKHTQRARRADSGESLNHIFVPSAKPTKKSRNIWQSRDFCLFLQANYIRAKMQTQQEQALERLREEIESTRHARNSNHSYDFTMCCARKTYFGTICSLKNAN